MGIFDVFNHLFNFLLPAASVALLLALFARLFIKKQGNVSVIWSYIAINFIVCAACLVAGLVFFGRDAKMATYALMVLAGASCQWVLIKGWRG
jgi:hypothetical protein